MTERARDHPRPKRSDSGSGERRRKLDRLRALRTKPAEQAGFAIECISSERDPFFLQAVLDILAPVVIPAARIPLLQLYTELDQKGQKVDPGGYVRARVLNVLRNVATSDDVALFEHAAQTYEVGLQEGTAVLRAAGLLALDAVDPELALLHAARLLRESRESGSGEPALTAARLLAATDAAPLLYYFVLSRGGSGEVLAEAVKGLRTVPGQLLEPVLSAADIGGDYLLLGCYDLAIAHEPDPEVTRFISAQLRHQPEAELYRYLVSALVASHRPDLLALLLDFARTETNRKRLPVLADVLALMPGDSDAREVLAELRRKLEALPDEPPDDEEARRPFPGRQEHADEGGDDGEEE